LEELAVAVMDHERQINVMRAEVENMRNRCHERANTIANDQIELSRLRSELARRYPPVSEDQFTLLEASANQISIAPETQKAVRALIAECRALRMIRSRE